MGFLAGRQRLHPTDQPGRGQRFGEPYIPLAPGAAAEILSAERQEIKTDEPQILGRRSVTAQHRAADRRKVLDRTSTLPTDGDQLTVKHRRGRQVSERGGQAAQPGGQVRAVARPPAHPTIGAHLDQQAKPIT